MALSFVGAFDDDVDLVPDDLLDFAKDLDEDSFVLLILCNPVVNRV